MVRIRQEAVQEARFSVIRIAGLVRQGMVYIKVRDDVKVLPAPALLPG